MNAQRSILITGASSGIGRATTLRLAQRGWRVFATVRKADDGERLAAETGGGVEPVTLDVTDRRSIAGAEQKVAAALRGEGLDALLNNAGVGLTTPVEFTTEEALRNIFEVNLFGQISVIQEFLPLLRRARGRMINIGSVADHLTPPFGGAMAASKAAFASMSAALRLELRLQGIAVILIEPGSIDTPAVEKTLGGVEAKIGQLGGEGAALYGNAMRKVAKTFAHMEHSGSSPEVVAEVIERAVNDRRPKTRYPAGKDSLRLAWLAWALPEKLLDLAILKTFGLASRRPEDTAPPAKAP
jgi:NAD(P)-dependent dehydrogenase (short-subunit alcohol dehydrogenase family)